MNIWSDFAELGGIISSVIPNSAIGSLGEVVFEVTSWGKIFTFDNYKKQVGVRISSHEIVMQKPILESLGPDTQKILFTIKLRKDCGINPEKMAATLQKYCEDGEALQFILDGKPVGQAKWVINTISENAIYMGLHGEILSSELELTLTEYSEGEKNDFRYYTNDDGN